MGIGFVELAISRCFEEVKTNIFKMALPRCKLEDSQKRWSEKWTKGTIGGEKKELKEEIADSQLEKETIKTVNSKEDLEKWLKQGDNNTLKANWKLAEGSPAREVDMEMKEANKATEGLVESKHNVKGLIEEEIE